MNLPVVEIFSWKLNKLQAGDILNSTHKVLVKSKKTIFKDLPSRITRSEVVQMENGHMIVEIMIKRRMIFMFSIHF
jgi:hypothetical protein